MADPLSDQRDDAAWLRGFNAGRDAAVGAHPHPEERFALAGDPRVEEQDGEMFHVHPLWLVTASDGCRWCRIPNEEEWATINRMVQRIPFPDLSESRG